LKQQSIKLGQYFLSIIFFAISHSMVSANGQSWKATARNVNRNASTIVSISVEVTDADYLAPQRV